MLKDHGGRFYSLLIVLDVAVSAAIVFGFFFGYPLVTGLDAGAAWVMTPRLMVTVLVACMAWPLTLQQLGLYESLRLTAPRQGHDPPC